MARNPNPALERGFVARAFASRLREDDLHELLCYLNGLTDYRFTGVYQFTPGGSLRLRSAIARARSFVSARTSR